MSMKPSNAVPPPRFRRPTIVVEKAKPKAGARFAESAGEAAADCTAVVCCCPCGLANLLVVAVVKVPARLARRALRRRTKNGAGGGRNKEARLLPSRGVSSDSDDDFSIYGGFFQLTEEEAWPGKPPPKELLELEKQMTAKFYGAGFWRSPSQRE